jgi:hypothetical protein
MKYLKVYCNLIRKAENRTLPKGYTEKHHIFPVSIFGKNKRIVVLTAREHYIAHALLERIYIKRYGLKHWKTQKMICAFWCISNTNEFANSHRYKTLRERFIDSISGENNYNYGRVYTKEEKEHLSLKTKGIPKSKEHREKISKGKKGKPVSESHRQKLGHNKGKKWWNDGKGNRKLSIECPGNNWVIGMDFPCSEERREKIRVKAIGRVVGERSDETRLKLSKSNSKYIYELMNSNGEKFITHSLSAFCRENPQYGLYRRLLCGVANGKQKHHKGWTVRILEHLT